MNPTRRALLRTGLVAAAMTTTARIAEASPQQDTFLGLEAGTELGAWTVVTVRRRPDAVALVLAGPTGAPYQVDVLRRDAEAPGIADSAHYGVYLANGGDGDRRSDEEQARGALMVADYLRWAERTTSVVVLATMSERRHDGGEFRIL